MAGNEGSKYQNKPETSLSPVAAQKDPPGHGVGVADAGGQ